MEVVVVAVKFVNVFVFFTARALSAGFRIVVVAGVGGGSVI